MRSSIVPMVVAAGVAGAIVSGAASVDQTSTVPRLGSGSVSVVGDVNVKGDVRVVNEVSARQSGPWTVGVSGVVATSPQTLPFMRIGQTYVITWPDRAVDVVAPREIVGSWVRVDHSGGRARWINLAAALSIDDKSG